MNKTKIWKEQTGLDVTLIINERTVATLALALTAAEGNLNDAFDIGGQTFGVSLLTIDDGVFVIKATPGDTHLGVQDLNSQVVTYFNNESKLKHMMDISGSAGAVRLSLTACERAKRGLSLSASASIAVDHLTTALTSTHSSRGRSLGSCALICSSR